MVINLPTKTPVTNKHNRLLMRCYMGRSCKWREKQKVLKEMGVGAYFWERKIHYNDFYLCGNFDKCNKLLKCKIHLIFFSIQFFYSTTSSVLPLSPIFILTFWENWEKTEERTWLIEMWKPEPVATPEMQQIKK